MTSSVDICNMALSHIRGGSINALTESSIQAQQCQVHYATCRRLVLESAPWGFARRIRQLAMLSTTDIYTYAYAYQYPTDALRINKLVHPWDEVSSDTSPALRYHSDMYPSMKIQRVMYEVFNDSGSKVIAANDVDLRVDYNIDVEDPNLFSTPFVMALSHLLASSIAISIVGVTDGRVLRSDELNMYMKYIDSAIADDGNQSYTPTPDSDYITVR